MISRVRLATHTAKYGVVLGGCLLGASLIPFAHATPVSAVMSATAVVGVDGVTATNPDSSTWAVLLAPLSLSVSATATDPTNGASVTASGSGAAAWGNGGNSGFVQFSNFGWSTTPGGNAYSASLDSAGPDWSYTFIADADGTFTMNYNVVGSGSTFGLQGWNLGWTGAAGGLNLLNSSDPTISGTFTDAVVAGQSYTVSLQNNANVSGGGFSAGSMTGTFDFNIAFQSVPEPASVALFGAGLLGLGFARRRIRS